MRILAIAVLFASCMSAAAHEYGSCPAVIHKDPSIQAHVYSVSPNGDCANTKLDAIADLHLGVIYDMATPELSVSQEYVQPEERDVSQSMTPCPHITPRGAVTEWFVPKGESCEGRPYTAYRLFTRDGKNVCIMNAVWCVPIQNLTSLGQERARAALERGKRLRKITQMQ